MLERQHEQYAHNKSDRLTLLDGRSLLGWKMKSPFGISSVHTPKLIRSTDLRPVLSEKVAISGTRGTVAGGMTVLYLK